ncbi:MAG: hypothetical protein Q8L62_12410 [Candidatus Nitrotoga sp.]|nr:hypothetical protein [Candidatus Nitrotoga sp.]
MKGLTAFILVLLSTMAYAENVILPFPNNPKWEEECGSCHVTYPPQLLTQNDWERLMEGLDKHFGDNAVLDQKDNKEILDFLQRYAGNNNEHTAPSLGIRDTPWFTLKHRPIYSTLVTRYFTDWSNPAEKFQLSQIERAARPAMSELNAENGQNTLCACLAGNAQGATIDISDVLD